MTRILTEPSKGTIAGLLITVTTLLLAIFLPKDIAGALTTHVQWLILIIGLSSGIITFTYSVAKKTGAFRKNIVWSRFFLATAGILIFATIDKFALLTWGNVTWNIVIVVTAMHLGVSELKKN